MNRKIYIVTYCEVSEKAFTSADIQVAELDIQEKLLNKEYYQSYIDVIENEIRSFRSITIISISEITVG